MRIPPYHYLHVLDQNSNVTRLELGPKTFVRQDHEKVLVGPAKNIIIPPRQYCIIENPIVVDEEGKPVYDDAGQAKLRHADREIRLSQVLLLPFPCFLSSFLLFFANFSFVCYLGALPTLPGRVLGDEHHPFGCGQGQQRPPPPLHS